MLRLFQKPHTFVPIWQEANSCVTQQHRSRNDLIYMQALKRLARFLKGNPRCLVVYNISMRNVYDAMWVAWQWLVQEVLDSTEQLYRSPDWIQLQYPCIHHDPEEVRDA